MFLMDVLSIKEINWLRKEINNLLSKGMSNIYLKVNIEKNWRTQNFGFKRLKSSSPGQLWGSFNLHRYHWIFKLLVSTQKSEFWEQSCLWLFSHFYFERNYDVLKSKSPYFLLNKNVKFKVAYRVRVAYLKE